MMAPGSETVPALSREFKVTEATLYAWRRSALEAGKAPPGDGRNAERWSGPAKLAVVLETAALAEAEVGEYCRGRGLFPERVRSWRAVCEEACAPASAGAQACSAKADRQRIRDEEENAEHASLVIRKARLAEGRAWPYAEGATFGQRQPDERGDDARHLAETRHRTVV